MKIDTLEFSKSFITAASSAAATMMAEKTESRELEKPFSNYVVSLDRAWGANLVKVLRGDEAGIEGISELFIFQKEA